MALRERMESAAVKTVVRKPDHTPKNGQRDLVPAIDQWLETVPSRASDLHIDRLSPEWKLPANWLEGSVRSLKIATDRCRRTLPNYEIALVFSLKSSNVPAPPAFQTWDDLKRHFDQSPPSLYCFRVGDEPWISSRKSFAVIKEFGQDVLPEFMAKTCVFMSYQNDSEPQYWKSLAIIQ